MGHHYTSRDIATALYRDREYAPAKLIRGWLEQRIASSS